MIILEDTLISEDLLERKFCCNLNACKGACCIEGDWGAPLEESEVSLIEEQLPNILPYLSSTSQHKIRENGFFELDDEGERVTNCLSDGKCVFAIENRNGILGCGIEKAFLEGKTHFRKPISCHLYPVRLIRTETYTAVNYHQWNICNAACSKGEELGLPVFRFVKDALIRRFGEEWFNALQELSDQKLE